MKKRLFRLFLIGLLIPLWIYLRSVYRDRIGAFGCFDDCFNYMGGYFLLAGKRLYADIFFNHQPLPAYISALIQWITRPSGIYLLIYQHRMFLVYVSIIADTLLVLRFGLVGFGFAVLYETTKGFLFGERFLAEAMIVYPLVYLLLLIGELWRKKKLFPGELFIAAVAAWFVVFSREPYVPLAVVLFGYLLWKQRKLRLATFSLAFFVTVSILTIGLHSLPDYFFNVVTVNASRPGMDGSNGWFIILYPVLIFLGGSWNTFRIIEVVLAAIFWFLFIRKPLGMLLVFLTLANVRAVAPGHIYYAAFHHIVWYGLFIVSTLLLIRRSLSANARIIGLIAAAGFAAVTLWAIITPTSYLHEMVDRHAEFTTNFDKIFVNGGLIRTVSDANDTLFLDGWDDLIYWHAGRYSPYRYAWYTSNMHQFDVYRMARDEMFANSPPDFYYGQCARDGVLADKTLLTQELRGYVQLSPSCVFVRRTKLPEITDEQWVKAKESFAIPRP